MDAAGIRATCHEPAHGIDLAHQVALADAADGGIAGHLAERFDVVREQQGAGTHAGAGKRRLGAGVAAANDDDVERFRELHGPDTPGEERAGKDRARSWR